MGSLKIGQVSAPTKRWVFLLFTTLFKYLELVSGLLALARKGDKQLMDIFKASCDDNNYNEDTFDNDFFIENIENMLKLSSNKKIEK